VGFNLDLRSDDRYEVFLVEESRSVLSATGSLLRDRWLCLQLSVQWHETEGTVSLVQDGVLLLDATAARTRPPDGVELFTMGIDWSASNQAPGAIWLDDVVLDDAPVPCL
jgi:hypothetical protein